MKPQIEKPIFDKEGYQINMKDINGESLPDPKNLVSVSLESLGLPKPGGYKNLPIVRINGGARPGAGRKKIGRHPLMIRLLPKAEKKLRSFAKKEGVSISEAAEKMILQSA